ncbi:hypothetical protein [Streptomyces sp. NPDC020965]|uniref:hypothetical protein n=1 Tax=Streptomyces sp. NPDC020965 TaxID=3365105 RepID=UPI00379B6CE5
MITRRTGVTWLALLLATLFCAYAGWSLFRAGNDDSLAYAEARDRALADGTGRLSVLTSHDAADTDGARLRRLDAATGQLHDELRRAKPVTGPTARATVTEAALTALDTRAGTARLIATVRVELKPAGGTASGDRKRLEATLARTDDGWKVQTLTAVPVGGA